METDILTQLGGLGTLAPGTLLLALGALFIRAVMNGALVPRKTHDDISADRDHWRSAYEVERRRIDHISNQIDVLLEASATTVQVAEAIQRVVVENTRERS